MNIILPIIELLFLYLNITNTYKHKIFCYELIIDRIQLIGILIFKLFFKIFQSTTKASLCSWSRTIRSSSTSASSNQNFIWPILQSLIEYYIKSEIRSYLPHSIRSPKPPYIQVHSVVDPTILPYKKCLREWIWIPNFYRQMYTSLLRLLFV